MEKQIYLLLQTKNVQHTSKHLEDLLTCFKAESLGACWISWREEFWTASFSVVFLNSGCWGVKTNAGWLHSLRRYCNAFKKGEESIYKSPSRATNVHVSIFPMLVHLSKMPFFSFSLLLCSFFKKQFKYLICDVFILHNLYLFLWQHL